MGQFDKQIAHLRRVVRRLKGERAALRAGARVVSKDGVDRSEELAERADVKITGFTRLISAYRRRNA